MTDQVYPFTGTGFTSNVQAQSIPEWILPPNTRIPFYPLYLLCLAANGQAADTGPSSALRAVQHLGFALPVLMFGFFGPMYAATAEMKGEIRGTFGMQKKGDKFFKHTVSWYQRNGGVCLLIGGAAMLAFVVGLWAPLMITLQ